MKCLILVLTLILILLLSSCASMKQVVDPIEAMQICDESGVRSYSALSGRVTCRE